MVQERLRPGVEDGEEADRGAQVPRVAGDLEQGLRGRAEQDLVDDLLVAQRERGDGLGYGEDDVEVGDNLFMMPLIP